MWNDHVLPVLLRCMADVFITFSWIAKDVPKRSRQFIEYGLGQEKLAIEKCREVLSKESKPDPDAVAIIEVREQMLDSERYRFLIPVNLGAWSEMNTRKMAIEVGEESFYDLVFTQFSAAVHSTWQHIWRMNLYPCSNPLHMGHRIPVSPELPPNLHLFVNSAKYLCKTFAKFDAEILKAEKEPYKCYHLLTERISQYCQGQTTNDESGDKQPVVAEPITDPAELAALDRARRRRKPKQGRPKAKANRKGAKAPSAFAAKKRG